VPVDSNIQRAGADEPGVDPHGGLFDNWTTASDVPLAFFSRVTTYLPKPTVAP